MISFLESAGVALIAALLTARWHALSGNEKPGLPGLAIGFDSLAATMVGYRWLVLLFLMLSAMALYLRIRGYEKAKTCSGGPGWPTARAASPSIA